VEGWPRLPLELLGNAPLECFDIQLLGVCDSVPDDQRRQATHDSRDESRASRIVSGDVRLNSEGRDAEQSGTFKDRPSVAPIRGQAPAT
jgi:hypothetical protein